MIDYENASLVDLLSVELNYVNDFYFYETTKRLLEEIDKIFPQNKTRPASSSGKFHPPHDNGVGGLIRHTKVVATLVNEYCSNIPPLENKKDIMVSAALLHDMGKYHSNREHTDEDHPLWMAGFILRKKIPNYSKEVSDLIQSHHGRWVMGTYNKEKVCNKEPATFDQWVFHLADLTSSKKIMHVNFDENTGEII